MMQPGRRRALQAGLAAGSFFLPLPYALVRAQVDGALKLLKAPKVALVVGNSKYKDAPELKNAVNDAKAMTEALKASGFAVTAHIDAGRDALIRAIREYVHAMEQRKCVGLFYFAGHGVQLEWRNYMLPIDAVIDRVDDVAKQSVDVARLMEGLTKAANPMNIIILDACRENPFPQAKQAAKGLSQMDAPTHTILAYATSPGNVASDGDGVNGLYTENLLREMKVPEAKIEDVFKRVRLGVRRKTNGAQIPWESTSLEDDFWFLPPAELKKLSDQEKERLFRQELALWEKVQHSKDPAPLVDYLSRHPSGQYSELAQLQLDRILAAQGEKRVEVLNAAENPFTKGSARADTAWRTGDSYAYRALDLYTKVESKGPTHTVTEITDREVVYSSGFVSDLLGNFVRLPDGRRLTPNQVYPSEFAVGKHWTTRFITTSPTHGEFQTEFRIRITAKERVVVPAGTFDAFRVEYVGNALGEMAITITRTNWFAPDKVRLPVAVEILRRARPPRGLEKVIESRRLELVSFKQG